MKKLASGCIAVLLFVCLLSVQVLAADYLIPVGRVVGLELMNDTVTVAAFDDALAVPARKAGLCIGDRIAGIDGKEIRCADDVRQALRCSKGSIHMSVLRQGKRIELKLAPEITKEGPKLGVYLKQGVTGIGTVTWYDPETGKFGTLGHGVNGPEGELLAMTSGKAYAARIVGVARGQVGKPGQLQGAVESKNAVGSLSGNTVQGVFGTAQVGWTGTPMEVAGSDEVKPGAATIRSTVSGSDVQEYSVEILKIYPKAKQGGRNLLIRVTDPALLQATGGIVQGMSGSPIIQDGKLVGAVTHVLVNDPTTGYGIFIENMLDAAA